MLTIDLNIELLRCFIAVAECRNFTAAGLRLRRTQSAISVRIQKLEETLGQRLFDRTSRSVELTRQGEQLLPYAKKLLALNDETVNTLCAPELCGQLRIGVVEYLTPQRIPLIVAELRRLHPKIRVEIKLASSRELLRALDAHEIDIAIANNDPLRTDGETLFQEPLLWVSGDTNFNINQAPIPLCLLPTPCVYRAAAIQALAQSGHIWAEVLSTSSVYGVQLAVEAGIGISVLGASALTPAMHVLGPANGLATLPVIEIAAFGLTPANQPLAAPFIEQLRWQYSSSLRG